VYANYLETCAMLGIKPTRRKRTDGLIAQWSDTIAIVETMLLLKH